MADPVEKKKRFVAPKGNKFAVGNKGGGPIGNQKALGSTTNGAPEKYTEEWLELEAIEMVKWFEKPRNIWLKGFALERGYSPVRFDEFQKKSAVFAEALCKAKALQESKLVQGGLFNETNAGFTKFVLENNHAWSERQKIMGDASNPLNFIFQKDDGGSKNLIDE